MFARMKPVLYLAPIALLCVIACRQIARAHSSELTPWKGGGFGMFSTVDQPATRYIKCFLVVDGRSFPVRLPDSFANKTKRIKADPSQERLEKLLDQLAELGIPELLSQASDSERSTELERTWSNSVSYKLEAEIWRYGFERESNQIQAARLFGAQRTLEVN